MYIQRIGILSQSGIWNGLTGYYGCNSTAGTTLVDALGISNGTVSSASIWNSAGMKGYCLNSANTYYGTVSATLSNAMFSTTNGYSISLWHNVTNLSAVQNFLDKAGTSGNRVFALQISYEGPASYNKYRVTLANSSGTWAYTGIESVDAVFGAWTHLVLTVTIGVGFKLYVNGVLSADVAVATAGFKNTGTTPLSFCTGAAKLNGKLDEVGLWNRVLSLTEVKELYNGGSGIFY